MSISRLNADKQKLKYIYVLQKYLSANVYKRKTRPTIEFPITSFTEPDSLVIHILCILSLFSYLFFSTDSIFAFRTGLHRFRT